MSRGTSRSPTTHSPSSLPSSMSHKSSQRNQSFSYASPAICQHSFQGENLLLQYCPDSLEIVRRGKVVAFTSEISEDNSEPSPEIGRGGYNQREEPMLQQPSAHPSPLTQNSALSSIINKNCNSSAPISNNQNNHQSRPYKFSPEQVSPLSSVLIQSRPGQPSPMLLPDFQTGSLERSQAQQVSLKILENPCKLFRKVGKAFVFCQGDCGGERDFCGVACEEVYRYLEDRNF